MHLWSKCTYLVFYICLFSGDEHNLALCFLYILLKVTIFVVQILGIKKTESCCSRERWWKQDGSQQLCLTRERRTDNLGSASSALSHTGLLIKAEPVSIVLHCWKENVPEVWKSLVILYMTFWRYVPCYALWSPSGPSALTWSPVRLFALCYLQSTFSAAILAVTVLVSFRRTDIFMFYKTNQMPRGFTVILDEFLCR